MENDSCSVDAIQVITSCAMGKDNLIFKDHGKHVYTINRNTGVALRLSLNKGIDKMDSDFCKLRDKAFSKSSCPEDNLEFENRMTKYLKKFWPCYLRNYSRSSRCRRIFLKKLAYSNQLNLLNVEKWWQSTEHG